MPSTCCASTSSPPGRGGSPSSVFSRTASQRGAAFQHLEAVGRHQQRAARLVEPVVGAADALDQAAGALGRADLDDQIDRRPSRCRDRARRSRPRRAGCRAPSRPRPCAAARGAGCRDAARSAGSSSLIRHSAWKISSAWARVLTKTRVVPALLDALVDLGDAHAAPYARTRADVPRVARMSTSAARRRGRGPMAARRRPGRRARRPAPLRRPRSRTGRRRRQPGASCAQPRQAERQQVAALVAGQRMQLVDDDAAQAGRRSVGASA